MELQKNNPHKTPTKTNLQLNGWSDFGILEFCISTTNKDRFDSNHCNINHSDLKVSTESKENNDLALAVVISATLPKVVFFTSASFSATKRV